MHLFHSQLYGRPLIQFVQRPGEAVFLPSGMPHAVLNLRDGVAVTTNHLFVDALPSENISSGAVAHNLCVLPIFRARDQDGPRRNLSV